VREPARELAPRRHSFGLHQPVALIDELTGHRRKRFGKRRDLAGRG